MNFNIMELNLEFAEKILKAMFVGWNFNYNIDIHDNTEFSFSIEDNENQYLILKNENSNGVAIYINTRSENNKLLGYYYLKDRSKRSFDYKNGEFERKRDFFEIMFLQHLAL